MFDLKKWQPDFADNCSRLEIGQTCSILTDFDFAFYMCLEYKKWAESLLSCKP